ncbi:MAG: hypothetical protein HYV28_20925, partial [Ignavibacteriales bacterium]|nr:hypothetical protein [Ignavibacteriales bacterium]
MKSLWFASLIFILVNNSNAQDTELLERYKIPCFSSHKLYIEAPELLNIYTSDNSFDGSFSRQYNITIKAKDNFFYQDSLFQIASSSELEFRGKHEVIKQSYDGAQIKKESNTVYSASSYADSKYYLIGQKGVFISCKPGLQIFRNNSISPNSHSSWDGFGSSLISGLGYGRITSVKVVSQARMITKELKIRESEDLLISIAEILEKNEHGFYESNFRDSSKIKLYKDLSELTGSPQHIQRIKRIMESKLYRIAVQRSGWEIQQEMGYSFVTTTRTNQSNHETSGDREGKYGSNILINFAFPLSYDVQWDFSAVISRDLRIKSSLAVNHSINWFSAASVSYANLTNPDEHDFNGTNFAFESEYFLSNKTELIGTAGYSKGKTYFASASSPNQKF